MIAPPRTPSRKKKRNVAKSPEIRSGVAARVRSNGNKASGCELIADVRHPKISTPVAPLSDSIADDDLIGLNQKNLHSNFASADGIPQASGEFTDRLKVAIGSDDVNNDRISSLHVAVCSEQGTQGSKLQSKRMKSPNSKISRGRAKSQRPKKLIVSPQHKKCVKSPKRNKAHRARSPKVILHGTPPTPTFSRSSPSNGGRSSSSGMRAKSTRRTSKLEKEKLELDAESDSNEVLDAAKERSNHSRFQVDDNFGDDDEDKKSEIADGVEFQRVSKYSRSRLGSSWFQKLSHILGSSLSSERLFRLACQLYINYDFSSSKSFVRSVRKEFGKSLWDARLDDLIVEIYAILSQSSDYPRNPDDAILLKNATTVDKLKALGISLTYTCSRMDPNCKFRSKDFGEYKIHCKQVHQQEIDQRDIQLTKLSIPGMGPSKYENKQGKQKISSPTFSFGFKKKFNWSQK